MKEEFNLKILMKQRNENYSSAELPELPGMEV